MSSESIEIEERATKRFKRDEEMAKEAMNQLSEKMGEVESLVKSPDLFIHEHFKKIRNEIETKTETMKKDIDQQRDEYINKLNKLEEECKIKLNLKETKEHLNNIIQSIQQKFKELNLKANKLLLQESEADEIKVKTEKEIPELEKCQLKPNSAESPSIGQLTIKESKEERRNTK